MNQYNMGNIINKIRKFLLEGENEKAFVPLEVFIMNSLHNKKQELKTKENITLFLKELLPYLGVSQDEALYYYYLFSLNYQPNGDYKNLKKSELKDLSSLKSERTTNVKSHTYAKSKIPFKGSNLEGFWERDPKGVDQYVISSYNWYPIFLWKDGKWYRISDNYSRATSRQISNSGRELNYSDKVTRLTPDEMRRLRNGMDLGELTNRKQTELYAAIEKLIGKKFFVSSGYVNGPGIHPKVRFKAYVDSVEMDGDKINVNINITNMDSVNYSGVILQRGVNPEDVDLSRAKSDFMWKIRRFDDIWKMTPKMDTINVNLNYEPEN